MVMYMASMSSVPASLYESANLDGASRLTQFFRITIPLIWTNIRTTLTFFIISTINMAFLFVTAMTSGGPNHASEVALSYMYSQKNAGLSAIAMAIGVAISCSPSRCPPASTRPPAASRWNFKGGNAVCRKHRNKRPPASAEKLYKFFIYLVLVLLAVTIIVPVAWVFMASVKQNSEFYGNPWALPAGFYWQNFVDAWNGAKMGQYMLNSVAVTALALALLLVIALPAALLPVPLQVPGQQAAEHPVHGGLFINVNYIVVPIFLMLRDGDTWLKNLTGSGFLLNNLVVLAVVYAATALPFTIYLLSGYFATLPHDFEEAAYIDGASYFAAMVRIIFPWQSPPSSPSSCSTSSRSGTNTSSR